MGSYSVGRCTARSGRDEHAHMARFGDQDPLTAKDVKGIRKLRKEVDLLLEV
jgi:hypothetical protein